VRPGTTRTDFSVHRLGAGRERRRVSARAATPELVAQAIVRAAEREPRVAYVSWSDRLTVLGSMLAPRITDWTLGRTFSWAEREDDENVT
jgi:short-subunit dehydrogenase